MDDRIQKKLQSIRVLWFGLLLSNVFYIAIIASGAGAATPAPEVKVFAPALGALALGIALISFVMPARFFAIALRAMRIEIAEEPSEGIGGFRQAALARKRLVNPTQAVLDALTRFQTPFILGMALAEAISLFGFVLGFLGAPPSLYVGFFAVGITIMLIKLPRVTSVTRAIESAVGVPCPLKPSDTSINP